MGISIVRLVHRWDLGSYGVESSKHKGFVNTTLENAEKVVALPGKGVKARTGTRAGQMVLWHTMTTKTVYKVLVVNVVV